MGLDLKAWLVHPKTNLETEENIWNSENWDNEVFDLSGSRAAYVLNLAMKYGKRLDDDDGLYLITSESMPHVIMDLVRVYEDPTILKHYSYHCTPLYEDPNLRPMRIRDCLMQACLLIRKYAKFWHENDVRYNLIVYANS